MANSLIKRLGGFFLIFLFIFLSQYKGYSQEDRKLYYQGIQAARKGKVDSAFLSFYRLINNFPDSEYLEQTLFGTGEYYYSIGDHSDAKRAFSQLIDNYPNSNARLFAIAYLLKIAEKGGKESELESLKEELIGSQQVSLLFRDFKERSYTSPFNKNYKALNFIDKIEIYIDDELFAKISF